MTNEMSGFQKFRDSLIPGTLLGKVYSYRKKREEWIQLACKRVYEETKDYSAAQISFLNSETRDIILRSRVISKQDTEKRMRAAKAISVLEGIFLEVATYAPYALMCLYNFLAKEPPPASLTLFMGGSTLILRPHAHASLERFIEERSKMIDLEKKIGRDATF